MVYQFLTLVEKKVNKAFNLDYMTCLLSEFPKDVPPNTKLIISLQTNYLVSPIHLIIGLIWHLITELRYDSPSNLGNNIAAH